MTLIYPNVCCLLGLFILFGCRIAVSPSELNSRQPTDSALEPVSVGRVLNLERDGVLVVVALDKTLPHGSVLGCQPGLSQMTIRATKQTEKAGLIGVCVSTPDGQDAINHVYPWRPTPGKQVYLYREGSKIPFSSK